MSNKLIKSVSVSAVILLFLSVLPIRTAMATMEEAEKAALAATLLLAGEGFEVRDYYDTGTLDRGESYTFSRTFYRGNTYALVVGGCSYTKDIDIYIYDKYWGLVNKDVSEEAVAVIDFEAAYSGTYYIKVKMYEATSDNVHWALTYGYH